MAKKTTQPRNPDPAAQAASTSVWNRPWMPYAVLAVAVLVFYWVPLTSSDATPQWDTIDYHQGVLAHFFDSVKSLQLPYWTNDTFSGFPFLSDPQTGVWYPGNWILVLAGTGPKALELLLALHALLAGVGVFLLASKWVDGVTARLLASVLYMFGGFFAAHSSHLGMFETAAWLPLLLYLLHQAVTGSSWRPALWGGAAGGCMLLVGHFQTALYAGSVAGLYAVVLIATSGRQWPRLLRALASAAIAVALSAVQWMPAAALVPESARSGVAFSTQTNAALELKALVTLFAANAFHAASGDYSGPADITQFYYYGGLLAIPLAILGLISGGLRRGVVGGTLVVLPLWFAFGPHTGFYDAIMLLPGFSSVRAPVHIWFVISLGLSLLAGAGAAWAQARWRAAWMLPALAAVCFVDLVWWNSLNNQLAYAHVSYEQRYGDLEDHLVSAVNGNLPAGTRFHSGIVSASFGPMNGSLARKLEVTYGYNPLPLARYLRYYNTAASNPKLLAGLNAGLVLNAKQGTMERNPEAMPRFLFPRNLAPATGPAALAQHDPATLTLVDGGIAGITQDPAAKVEVVEQSESRTRLRCQAASASLLRTSIPWFPGWSAGAFPLKIVDHTFVGIVVPGGTGEFTLEFRPPYFVAGALVSLLALAVLAAGLVWRRPA